MRGVTKNIRVRSHRPEPPIAFSLRYSYASLFCLYLKGISRDIVKFCCVFPDIINKNNIFKQNRVIRHNTFITSLQNVPQWIQPQS